MQVEQSDIASTCTSTTQVLPEKTQEVEKTDATQVTQATTTTTVNSNVSSTKETNDKEREARKAVEEKRHREKEALKKRLSERCRKIQKEKIEKAKEQKEKQKYQASSSSSQASQEKQDLNLKEESLTEQELLKQLDSTKQYIMRTDAKEYSEAGTYNSCVKEIKQLAEKNNTLSLSIRLTLMDEFNKKLYAYIAKEVSKLKKENLPDETFDSSIAIIEKYKQNSYVLNDEKIPAQLLVQDQDLSIAIKEFVNDFLVDEILSQLIKVEVSWFSGNTWYIEKDNLLSELNQYLNAIEGIGLALFGNINADHQEAKRKIESLALYLQCSMGALVNIQPAIDNLIIEWAKKCQLSVFVGPSQK